MRNRRLFLPVVTLLPVALLVFWLLPAILKAIPSRYVARLPEPVQALGERGDGPELLWTLFGPVRNGRLPQAQSRRPQRQPV